MTLMKIYLTAPLPDGKYEVTFPNTNPGHIAVGKTAKEAVIEMFRIAEMEGNEELYMLLHSHSK